MAKGKGIEARPRLFQLRPINFLARKESLLFFLLPLYASLSLPPRYEYFIRRNVEHSGRKKQISGRSKVCSPPPCISMVRVGRTLSLSLSISGDGYTQWCISTTRRRGHGHSAFGASGGLSLCTSETDCGFLNCADPPAESWCFLRLNKAPLFLFLIFSQIESLYEEPDGRWLFLGTQPHEGKLDRADRKRGLVRSGLVTCGGM